MAEADSLVYIVEDEPEIREALEDITSKLGFSVSGFSTSELCLDKMESRQCDVLVTDLKLPGIDGVELARRVHAEYPDISIIFITAYGNLSSALQALEYGAEDYIIKPFNVESIKHSLKKVENRRRLQQENEEYRTELKNELDRRKSEIVRVGRQLEETFFKTVQLLGNAQESREVFLHGRTERITIFAVQTAQKLGWTNEQLVRVAISAPVSDVGKISISDLILNKKEPLDEKEIEEIRSHVLYGEQIIRSLPHFQDVGAIIRYHHERLDGSGYPEGLRDYEILPEALLIGLCDTFDAMVHDRPWRTAHSVAEAKQYLRDKADTLFPQEMVEAFIQSFEENQCEKILATKPVNLFYELTFPLLELANI